MIKKPIYSLMIVGLLALIGHGNVFGAIKDISESKKIKLNLLKDKSVSESKYENIRDYGTRVIFLEIIEVNESNVKERIPIVIKKRMPQVMVDKARRRIVLNYPLVDRNGKKVDLLNKGRTETLLVRHVRKFRDGRFPVDTDVVEIFKEIPAKIIDYKEYIPPVRYFGGPDIEHFRSFSSLEMVLSVIAGNGEVQVEIDSDKFGDKNIKIQTDRTKAIEFPKRKIDLSKYGDLKKIELRSDYKLPKEMVARTMIYITNYGVYSIFGKNIKSPE